MRNAVFHHEHDRGAERVQDGVLVNREHGAARADGHKNRDGLAVRKHPVRGVQDRRQAHGTGAGERVLRGKDGAHAGLVAGAIVQGDVEDLINGEAGQTLGWHVGLDLEGSGADEAHQRIARAHIGAGLGQALHHGARVWGAHGGVFHIEGAAGHGCLAGRDLGLCEGDAAAGDLDLELGILEPRFREGGGLAQAPLAPHLGQGLLELGLRRVALGAGLFQCAFGEREVGPEVIGGEGGDDIAFLHPVADIDMHAFETAGDARRDEARAPGDEAADHGHGLGAQDLMSLLHLDERARLAERLAGPEEREHEPQRPCGTAQEPAGATGAGLAHSCPFTGLVETRNHGPTIGENGPFAMLAGRQR